MLNLHALTGLCLILFHGTFLVRGVYLLNTGKKPGPFDKIVRLLAQVLMLPAFVSGIISIGTRDGKVLPFHLTASIAIIVAVPVHFIFRKFIFKTKNLPWLLPALIFFLIVVTSVCGFFRL